METNENICPVEILGKYFKNQKWGENESLFGEMLRLRIEGQLKTAAVANGVNPSVIGSHSLRAGGATALYVRGISVTLTQRFGRWKSASFLRYLRFGSLALEPLTTSISSASGMLNQLRMSNSYNKADSSMGRIDQCRAGGNRESRVPAAVSANDWETDAEALLDREEDRGDYLCRSPSVNSVDLRSREIDEASPLGGRMGRRHSNVFSDGDEKEEEQSPSRITSPKGMEGYTGKCWRERSPEQWSGSESELGEVSAGGVDSDSDQPVNMTGAVSDITPICEIGRFGLMQATMEGNTADPKQESSGEKKHVRTKGMYPRVKKVKKEPKSEDDFVEDLSASEASISKEQVMIKEEVWNEDAEGKRDRNREALDKFAQEHQNE